MSRLNASAYEFVPGKGFTTPQKPAQPPPAPLERPEQTEAPRPPPTISLNIGGSKPVIGAPQPTPARAPAPVVSPAPILAAQVAAKSTPNSSKPATPKPHTTVKAETAGASSKTFTTEKAKTDAAAVAQDVKSAADQAVLEDLYGNSTFISLLIVPGQPYSFMYQRGNI